MKSKFVVLLALLVQGLYPVTLSISQDSYIQNGINAANNFNTPSTSTNMQVANRFNFVRASYFEVNFSSSFLSHESAVSSSFTLQSNSAPISTPTPPASFNLDLYGIVDNADTWSESTLTFNSAPKVSGTVVSSTGTIYLGSVNIDPTTWTASSAASWSGASLDNYINWGIGKLGDYYGTGATSDTDQKLTFMVWSSGSTLDPVIQFGSSTATVIDRPTMNFTVVPEPSTNILLALGLITFAIVIKRNQKKAILTPAKSV